MVSVAGRATFLEGCVTDRLTVFQRKVPQLGLHEQRKLKSVSYYLKKKKKEDINVEAKEVGDGPGKCLEKEVEVRMSKACCIKFSRSKSTFPKRKTHCNVEQMSKQYSHSCFWK